MTPASVIIPAYRAEKTIARAVKSMLAQAHHDWEMIIVADDEQDYHFILQSQGIIDSRLRFATTGKTAAGPGTARNTGLDLTKHAIVAYLDADDAYGKDYLSLMISLTGRYGACHSAIRVIDEETGKELPVSNRAAMDMPLAMPHLLRHCVAYANLVIDRNRCHARWPEDIHYGEDLLFCLLILDELPAIYYSAQAQYDYYYRIGSLARPDEKDTRGLCERRRRMIQWLSQDRPPVHNAANREFMKRWLHTCNDAEKIFDYRLVDPGAYKAEMNVRLEALIKEFQP